MDFYRRHSKSIHNLFQWSPIIELLGGFQRFGFNKEQSGEQPSTVCRALHITMTQGEDPEVELESQDTHAFFYDFCYL